MNQLKKLLAACRRNTASTRPDAARSAGFTLVEALMATLLMAIILGALGAVTGQWLPSWNRGFATLQRIGLLATGLDRVMADLAAAEIVSAGGAVPAFDGTALSVIFVRTTLGPNAVTGLEFVRIAQTTDSRGPALVRSTAPFVPMIDGVTELTFSNPVVIVRAPYRVVFSYAGPDRVWRDSWRGAPQLPRAIRVRVQDAATQRTLVSTATPVDAELSARCAAAWARLAQVESRLGSNEGANAALLTDCVGPSASAGPGGTAGAGVGIFQEQ